MDDGDLSLSLQLALLQSGLTQVFADTIEKRVLHSMMTMARMEQVMQEKRILTTKGMKP